MNGASASLARRREISVLPTPVGPIIRMFLGVTSCRSSSGSCWRRQRFLSATATARLASSCPTILRSSSATIWRGERWVVSGIVVAFRAALVEAQHHEVIIVISAVDHQAPRVAAVDLKAEALVEAQGPSVVLREDEVKLENCAPRIFE